MCCTRSVLCRLCWVASLSYCNLVCLLVCFFFSPLVFCNPLLCTLSEDITRSQGVWFGLICAAVLLVCAISSVQVWGFRIFLLHSHEESLAGLCPYFVPVMGVTVNVCWGWNLSNKSQAGFCISWLVGSELAAILNFSLAQPLPRVILCWLSVYKRSPWIFSVESTDLWTRTLWIFVKDSQVLFPEISRVFLWWRVH